MGLFYVVSGIADIAISKGKFETLMALVYLVLAVFLFIYRIRIFLQILKLFGLPKKWILLWLIASWLPTLILGLGKKYEPNMDLVREESWEAGQNPVYIPNLEPCAPSPVREGLSVRLHERTAMDLGKKRYLMKDNSLNIPPKSLMLLLDGSVNLGNADIQYVLGAHEWSDKC